MIFTYEERHGAPLLVSTALSFHSVWTFSPADELQHKRSTVFSRARSGIQPKPPAIPTVTISRKQQKDISKQEPTSTGTFVEPPKQSGASKPSKPKPTPSKVKPKLLWNSQTQTWVQQ